jgi:hypothetical protein
MGLARIIGKKKWHIGAFSCTGSVASAPSRKRRRTPRSFTDAAEIVNAVRSIAADDAP